MGRSVVAHRQKWWAVLAVDVDRHCAHAPVPQACRDKVPVAAVCLLEGRTRNPLICHFCAGNWTRRSTLLGGERRTNGSNMGEPVRTRKEKLAGRVEHDARLGRVVQVGKRGAGNPLICDETKLKEEKNKKNGRKKKAHRGQSVRYRSWWKQGNIKMAVSKDHASCWVQRSHCHNKTNSGFVDSSEGVGRKGRMSSTTDRYRAGILDGHRDRQIRRLRFPRYSHSG